MVVVVLVSAWLLLGALVGLVEARRGHWRRAWILFALMVRWRSRSPVSRARASRVAVEVEKRVRRRSPVPAVVTPAR